jgi:hypothetical protein
MPHMWYQSFVRCLARDFDCSCRNLPHGFAHAYSSISLRLLGKGNERWSNERVYRNIRTTHNALRRLSWVANTKSPPQWLKDQKCHAYGQAPALTNGTLSPAHQRVSGQFVHHLMPIGETFTLLDISSLWKSRSRGTLREGLCSLGAGGAWLLVVTLVPILKHFADGEASADYSSFRRPSHCAFTSASSIPTSTSP